MEPRNVILAAGGILWRCQPEGLKCAVVLRARYRGERALPKGKVQEGESLEQAALREVQEETGHEATLLGYAGSTSYTYDHIHKIVFFWNMTPKGESSFRSSEEIERVDWLTPEEAMRTLTHPEEKTVVGTAWHTVRETSSAGVLERLRRAWIKTVGSARWDRLDGDLRVAEVQIEHRICARLRTKVDHGGEAATEPSEVGRACWADAALNLLTEAKVALRQCRIDQGWKFLHAARRMEIFSLDEHAELLGRAAALRAESEKLKSWRQKAIHALLGTPEEPRDVGIGQVYQATLIRDEHYDNQGYKDGLFRTQMLSLVVILLVIMVWLFGLIQRWDLLADQPGNQSTFQTFVAISVFGLLGGTVSAMFRASDTSQSARIPELTAATRVTFMRIFMGGASAVIVYVLLSSDLLGVVKAGITKAILEQPNAKYAVAFLAGFSERLVLRAVEHVVGKE